MMRSQTPTIPRLVRKITEPSTQVTNIVGTGFFSTAGIINAAATLKGSAITATQAILEDLPIFAFVQGIVHVIDGLTASTGYLTDADFITVTTTYTGGKEEIQTGKTTRYLRGVPTQGDLWVYDQGKARFLRGMLRSVQIAADITLAEGGAEALGFLGKFNTSGFFNLPFRFAIHHLGQFLLALQDFFALREEEARLDFYGPPGFRQQLGEIPTYDPNDINIVKFVALGRLVRSTLAMVGWVLLGIDSSNLYGWIFLAAQTIDKIYEDRYRIGLFFFSSCRKKDSYDDLPGPTYKYNP